MSTTNLKLCQYGEDCYRRNPIHFKEYYHPHLDQIYQKGPDTKTNKYVIPDELSMSAEIICQQLQLLEKLFPKDHLTVKTVVTKKKIDSSISGCSGGYRLGDKDTQEQNMETLVGKHKSSESDDCKPETSRNAKTTVNNPGYSSESSYETTAHAAESTEVGKASSNKKQKITRNIKDYIPVVLPKGQMAQKLEKAAPYNFFLTAITDCKQTHLEPLTVTLQEILDESLGEIETSLQINFMVDIGWLLGHYYFAGAMNTPLLVLYGDETPELQTITQHQLQVTAIKVNMPTPFATSHTKMMLLGYKDGSMRVVVSTANLYEDDWHNRTQGVWISPNLPALPDDSDTAAGESPTGFKQDLMLYLVEYKIAKLQPWIARIRKSDFGSVNVFLIGSVPGGFREGPRGHPWGHPRLGGLLQKHATNIDEKVAVVCQSSSIGSLGPNIQAWIQHDFLNSLRKDTQPLCLRQFPPFKMIYPSFGNVQNSHDGMLGGGCLPYGKNTNEKQPWLKNYLHQWKSKMRYRSQAMPHIKSYTRFSLQDNCVYWFVLTSANLSKAAWGSFNKNTNIQPCLRIANYEAGVLFLPRFVTGEETFPLASIRDSIPPFPLPYDVPLSSYGPDDTPFLMDYLH